MQISELTKLYYSVGEVAELFGVAPYLIRYWEAGFTSLRPAKNNRGERKYNHKDIETIQTIYHLVKEKGFTVEGANKELLHQKKESKEQISVLKKLVALKKKLLVFKNTFE